jgi:hypothetical protein
MKYYEKEIMVSSLEFGQASYCHISLCLDSSWKLGPVLSQSLSLCFRFKSIMETDCRGAQQTSAAPGKLSTVLTAHQSPSSKWKKALSL